jgi:hypothetical protein
LLAKVKHKKKCPHLKWDKHMKSECKGNFNGVTNFLPKFRRDTCLRKIKNSIDVQTGKEQQQ